MVDILLDLARALIKNSTDTDGEVDGAGTNGKEHRRAGVSRNG